MKIIIAGGRNFKNYDFLKAKVSGIISNLSYSKSCSDYTIISGGAKGADVLGERFAIEFGFSQRVIEADWENLGKKAGPIRNQRMAKYAKEDNDYSMLIAFWDGKSKGTKNMIDEAIKNRFDEIHIYRY